MSEGRWVIGEKKDNARFFSWNRWVLSGERPRRSLRPRTEGHSTGGGRKVTTGFTSGIMREVIWSSCGEDFWKRTVRSPATQRTRIQISFSQGHIVRCLSLSQVVVQIKACICSVIRVTFSYINLWNESAISRVLQKILENYIKKNSILDALSRESFMFCRQWLQTKIARWLDQTLAGESIGL